MSIKEIAAPALGSVPATSLKIGDVDGGNYAYFDTSGYLKFYGDARAWDDFSVPATQLRQGALAKPDFDYVNNGLLFPQNDDGEIAYLVMQMKHNKALGTDIGLHIHYIQEESNQPTFYADYRWYNNGAAPPGSWTTINTGDGDKGIYTYPGSGSMLQIGEWATISPPASEAASSNLDLQIYRDDNDVTGDVLAKYIDIHYLVDSLGTDDEYE